MVSSKIVSLAIENVQKITAVDITPGDGEVVMIGGKNASGKTSILDSIEMALGGASTFSEKPLREGAKSGSIRMDLGDLIVERRFLESGTSSLVVSTKDGAKYGSPQKILDALYCRLSFDPLEFLKLKGTDQGKMLAELVGIDTRELDKEHASVYDERTAVNRLVKEAESDVNRLPAIAGEDDVPAERPDVVDLSNRINKAREIQASHTRHSEHVADLMFKLQALHDKQAELVTESGTLGEQWDAARDELSETQSNGMKEISERHERELRDLVSRQTNERERFVSESKRNADKLTTMRADAIRLNDEAISKGNAAISALEKTLGEQKDMPLESHEDIGELQAQFQAANANMLLWDAVARKREKQAILAKRKAESDALTKRLEGIAEKKRDMMAKAKYPIDGLAFSDSGSVLFEGVPFAQSSRAQQIRTSVAIGIAMNPKLRVLLIRDGSLLDEDNLQIVREMATEAGAQIWIERVGDKDECAIIIEDGHIKGVEPVVAEDKPAKAEKKTRKKSAKAEAAGDAVEKTAEPVESGPSPGTSLFAS